MRLGETPNRLLTQALTGKEGKETERNKRSKGMTSLDIEFRQLLVFPRRFLSGDRNQDNDKLQNGLYLDMPSHSSAN